MCDESPSKCVTPHVNTRDYLQEIRKNAGEMVKVSNASFASRHPDYMVLTQVSEV